MKKLTALAFGALIFSQSLNAQAESSTPSLYQYKWKHGVENCEQYQGENLEVFQQNSATYVIRQHKCSSFEAPFIYVLMGSEKVLVLDTGASDDATSVPLYSTIKKHMSEFYGNAALSKEIIVLHSHSHSDHHQGDVQFKQALSAENEKATLTLVEPNQKALQAYFKFNEQQQTSIDLGNRRIDILFTPGHQEEAITLYDHQTQWLLTGDTFYPGLIYVKHWKKYRESLNHIVEFGTQHPVSAVLGGHIEMQKNTSEIYPIGTLYQPNERPLALSFGDLKQVQSALTKKPNELKQEKVIIMPMNFLQKSLSAAAKWIFG